MLYQPSITNVYLLRAMMALQCELATKHGLWISLLSPQELIYKILGEIVA